jgi:hypothetical protein
LLGIEPPPLEAALDVVEVEVLAGAAVEVVVDTAAPGLPDIPAPEYDEATADAPLEIVLEILPSEELAAAADAPVLLLSVTEPSLDVPVAPKTIEDSKTRIMKNKIIFFIFMAGYLQLLHL